MSESLHCSAERLLSPGANHASEKPAAWVAKSKARARCKPMGKGVRQPMQLSLDVRVIQTLNAMRVNKSALFVELLQQYEPFEEGDEFDHDQMEEE